MLGPKKQNTLKFQLQDSNVCYVRCIKLEITPIRGLFLANLFRELN